MEIYWISLSTTVHHADQSRYSHLWGQASESSLSGNAEQQAAAHIAHTLGDPVEWLQAGVRSETTVPPSNKTTGTYRRR